MTCPCLTPTCHGYHAHPTVDLRARERRYTAGYSVAWDVYHHSRWIGAAWSTGTLPAYRWHIDGQLRGAAGTLAGVAEGIEKIF